MWGKVQLKGTFTSLFWMYLFYLVKTVDIAWWCIDRTVVLISTLSWPEASLWLSYPLSSLRWLNLWNLYFFNSNVIPSRCVCWLLFTWLTKMKVLRITGGFFGRGIIYRWLCQLPWQHFAYSINTSTAFDYLPQKQSLSLITFYRIGMSGLYTLTRANTLDVRFVSFRVLALVSPSRPCLFLLCKQ